MSQFKGKNSKKAPKAKPQKNQVSLAGVAKNPDNTDGAEKKRGFPWKWIVAAVVLIALLVVGMLLFRLWDDKQEEKPALTAREMISYTYTPDKLAGDVSYYLVGVKGAEVGDTMDMLALMCFDRKAQAVSVMQIPVQTYIDKDLGFAVDTIGDVWYNPQPQVACSACRELVPERDRDGNVHSSCGAELENWKGSAIHDLARVINEQYGLPIDNYFILSRDGLAEMIDGVGGVEIELAEAVTLAETPFAAGVQTLDGQSAVEYAVSYNYLGTPESDRARMIRQRQVLASLWDHIAACSAKDLYYEDDLGSTKGILGRLMLGANAIYFNETSFGRARMLGISDKEAESVTDYDAIARFAMQLGDVPLDKVTFSILPGELAELGATRAYYSVNRDQLLTLIDEQLNPYDLTIDPEAITVPQLLAVASEVDLATATLDTMLAVKEEVPVEGEEVTE